MVVRAEGPCRARRLELMVRQIDIAPTILGLLGMDYRPRFFGVDVFQPPPSRDPFPVLSRPVRPLICSQENVK